jgi:selenocysteine-specific elongation factor
VIVATAGHVDHGKTSLVRALTGEDTDRLPEEKRRGMSIDLGFAYLPHDDGDPIAFVDVPGHERFIRNMAAGVQGIDLALLVVAADDGPMPQTHEHLAILDLFGVPRLLAVLTKADRVGSARVDEVAVHLRALLAASRFGEVEVLAVSPVTGAGLEALRSRLVAEARLIGARPTGDRFRMNVDRAFVIDGLGLVATGTVLSGTIGANDTVQVLPAGREARVRSLRANHGEAARASAGQRCALALHGLERGEVERGDTIVDVGPAPRAKHLDVLLHPLPEAGDAFARRCQLTVHVGTSALPAQVQPLVRGGALARLGFPREVSAWHGDRVLLRDPGARRLLGAATVLDPMPSERGAARAARLAALERIAGGAAETAFGALLEAEPGLLDLEWFGRGWHLSAREVERLQAARPIATFAVRNTRHAMASARWTALCDALEQAVAAAHASQPEAIGARPAELKAALAGHAPDALPAAIDELVRAGRLVREGPRLRLPGHRPVLSAKDDALWQRVGALLAGDGGRPPRVHELAAALALEPKDVADFLQRAARAGRAYRVAPNRYFLPEAVGRLVELAVSLDEESAGNGFGAATYRDRSGLGRNLTIQVLEFLDEAGYTRRVGEVRRARKVSLEEKRPRWDARTSNPARGV